MTKKEINEHFGRIQDDDVASYKKITVNPCEEDDETDDIASFTQYKGLSYEIWDDFLGVCHVEIFRDSEMLEFDGSSGAEFEQDETAGFLQIDTDTDDQDWKASFEDETETEFIGPDRSISARGYVYPLCGYADSSEWAGIQPANDVYTIMDAISSESEAIYQIVDKLCFYPDDKFCLDDAIFDAEEDTDTSRVVVAFANVELKNHNITAYKHIVRLVDKVFGEKQAILFWMDNTTSQNSENDEFVKNVAAILANQGFELFQSKRDNSTSNIILRKDQVVEEQLQKMVNAPRRVIV